jgi:hypothetical protein
LPIISLYNIGGIDMDKKTYEDLVASYDKTLTFIENYLGTLEYDAVKELIIKLINKQDVRVYYADIGLFIDFSRDQLVYVWGNNIESRDNMFDVRAYVKHLVGQYLRAQDVDVHKL